jgi:hypothetical protein
VFPVQAQYNEDGELLDNHLDERRFREGRAGDHLMMPFQCELCHFRNVYSRNPNFTAGSDREAMMFFRRASLNAFWSRAPSTVRGNLTEGRRGQRFCTRMNVPSLVPEMGPFPLRDSMGMMCAAAILDRSLDPGKNSEFVQWETFRGTRSFITNATQAGAAGLSQSVGAYEKNRMWISDVVTHSFWFTRFMEGLHKRVGEVRCQDEPISIEVLHAVEKILEREWAATQAAASRLRVAQMGAWFIAGFCGGLRGEEMLLIELAGTARSLEFLTDASCPHVILHISGRTKGNQLSGAKFGIPLAATTEGTHLQPGKWVKRLVELMTTNGDTRGRLFRRTLSPAKLFEFEGDFFRLLKAVQAGSSLIGPEVDVESIFGILRSSRRGMTAHARNMEVSKDMLKVFNRWHTEMNSSTGIARLDMLETYSSLDAIKPTLLRITRAF